VYSAVVVLAAPPIMATGKADRKYILHAPRLSPSRSMQFVECFAHQLAHARKPGPRKYDDAVMKLMPGVFFCSNTFHNATAKST